MGTYHLHQTLMTTIATNSAVPLVPVFENTEYRGQAVPPHRGIDFDKDMEQLERILGASVEDSPDCWHARRRKQSRTWMSISADSRAPMPPLSPP